jgi:hypothetical protein
MPVWLVVIVVAAGLAGGMIGAGVGKRRARRDNLDLLRRVREARNEERRAAVYLVVASSWYAYLQAVRVLAFPEGSRSADTPRDLAGVLRARAQLELFGSMPAQQLHDQALEAAVTLINVLRTLPRTPTTGEPDMAAGQRSLRVAIAEIGRNVDALERQMNHELRPEAGLGERSVEVTGRAWAGGDAVGAQSPSESGAARAAAYRPVSSP